MTLTATTEAELLAQPANDYMNDIQKQFFRELLLKMQDEIINRAETTTSTMQEHESA
ncbi:MAG: RNA polymerase-binding protein DksA, partial [Ectopseudomonas oleovorans]